MAEVWEIILPIIGAGIVGYIIRWIEEKRKRTHEREVEFRTELRKHLPDLVEPLYALLDKLLDSVIGLTNPDYSESREDFIVVKKHKITTPLREVKETLVSLQDFVEKNGYKLDLLLPRPLQSWQFRYLSDLVDKIIDEAMKGKISFDNIIDTIDLIMSIQYDFENIIGLETKIPLESEIIFAEPLSLFKKLKRKLRIR